MNLVSPEQLAAIAEAKEVNLTVLRDEVAKIAFEEFLIGPQVLSEICNGVDVEVLSKTVANLSYDFADAFMRERYERDSVARANMKANIPDRVLHGEQFYTGKKP